MQNSNISKNLYKIFLIFTKYTSFLLAILFVINTACVYFKMFIPIIYYFGGTSFIFIGLLYLISFVFQFCYLYRLPLHYVTFGNIIGIIDKHFTLSLSSIMLLRMYFIAFGVMLIAYVWLMCKNRNKPKVDPIKQLCETYCDCNCE